jgi:hypothetical protein
MSGKAPMSMPTVTTVADAIERMQQIAASLPASDGVACFNRMYLEVTQQISDALRQGEFADPGFISSLDPTFANFYFDAVDAAGTGGVAAVPPAWQPLFELRSNTDIYPVQFALAGMNAHINHDLPLAVVQSCTDLGTAPDVGTHHLDYQKVDALLDASEQSVRESFESGDALRADRDVRPVLDLIGNWSINSARDVAWDTAVALWHCREIPDVGRLMIAGMARTVAMASRCLLVPLR